MTLPKPPPSHEAFCSHVKQIQLSAVTTKTRGYREKLDGGHPKVDLNSHCGRGAEGCL